MAQPAREQRLKTRRVSTGHDRLTAVGQWLGRADQDDLARLRMPADPLTGIYRCPDEKAFAAFVLDVFARRIVGWAVADHHETELPLAALEMAVDARARAGQDVAGVVHHSDAGSEYTAIRYRKPWSFTVVEVSGRHAGAKGA